MASTSLHLISSPQCKQVREPCHRGGIEARDSVQFGHIWNGYLSSSAPVFHSRVSLKNKSTMTKKKTTTLKVIDALDDEEKKSGGAQISTVDSDVLSKSSSGSGSSGGGYGSSFLSVLCPLLKLFGGGDPSAPRSAFLEGDILSKTVRSGGVGLLASLITLVANVEFPGSVFGFELPLEVSQAGRSCEKSALDICDTSVDSESFSRATSLNELWTVAEDVSILDECAEEIATNLVPKEEAIQEVTNESVVQEAWQVVNENFLDARHNSWSADAWQMKKEEVLKSPIRSRMAAYTAIRTLLSSLNDPYTRFLTPDQFSQLSKYDVTGIGLNIGESATASGDSYLKVFGIILGSPAQLLGVRQGDELLEVAGNSVRGKTPFEAASLIQGPKGTMVSIKIRHGRCGTPQVFEVERQQDVRSPVYYRLERIQDSKQLSGYIHLKEFNALAKRDILIAMKRMQDAGAVSFVLDLRDNPGGLVQAGIEVARLFLDAGETVIETVGRDAKNIRIVFASYPPVTQAPLTILVNDHTASASEIVAAALHDNCRAVLVGNRTFGKGLIQAVYELSDGSGVVLTVGKYVTPGHQDIDGAGIEPDYKQIPSPSAGQEKLRGCKLLKASGNSSRKPAFS